MEKALVFPLPCGCHIALLCLPASLPDVPASAVAEIESKDDFDIEKHKEVAARLNLNKEDSPFTVLGTTVSDEVSQHGAIVSSCLISSHIYRVKEAELLARRKRREEKKVVKAAERVGWRKNSQLRPAVPFSGRARRRQSHHTPVIRRSNVCQAVSLK